MKQVSILSVLVVLVCGISLVCFTSCSTTVGGVEAGVYTGEPSVAHGGHAPHGGPPPHAPAHGYRKKHTYHYYPDTQVYFDISREVYFYLEGDQWRVSASLPDSIRIGLGDHVVVEMDTDHPYEYNKEHKHKYPPGQKKKKGKGKGKWGGDWD